MKITPTHVPAIPKPPATLSPELRRYLESITEALEIRLGRRGDPVDRAITLRELISSGLASELAATPFNPNLINSGNIGLGPGYVNLDVPPAVIGFDAAGAYSQVNIFWTYPYYANHNQTEIWSHTTDSLGDATLAAVSTGRSVVDPIGGGETRYYWARHVSNSGVKGPFNSSSGTLAVTATNPQAILAELEGAISVSQLSAFLAAQIDGAASAVDLDTLEAFTGYLGSEYDVATAGSLLTRVGDVEASAAGLVTTYGSTAASASSAADANVAAAAALAAQVISVAAKVAAIAAQTGAESAEDNAETAKTSAETSKAAAETAQTAASSSATSAAGSASTAGTSATNAATSENNAGSSATAAATSATTAATHATDAGTASSVANTAKLAAETARSGAETAETNAAASETNASGSSSAAAASATTAATSANNAGDSASAAASSATTATSQATAASQSATTAQTAKVAAETARSGAETAETNAAASETNASGSAAAAGTSATNAATSKNNAGDSATAASASASAALTQANAAGTSAVAAESSKNAAVTSAANALTYQNNAAQSATNADGSASAAASTVNGLTARLNNAGGTGVTVEQAYSASASSVAGLQAQYSVKIDNNGHVSGFGLNSVAVNGVPESAFVIRADKFAIVDPASTANNSTNTPSADVIPFGVTNGVVYIKSAAIEDGTITNAKIGAIDADKITTGFIRADRIEAGSIDASKITLVGVGTLIDLKSSATGGRMEILGNSIVVYDSTGALRVKLGAL